MQANYNFLANIPTSTSFSYLGFANTVFYINEKFAIWQGVSKPSNVQVQMYLSRAI